MFLRTACALIPVTHARIRRSRSGHRNSIQRLALQIRYCFAGRRNHCGAWRLAAAKLLSLVVPVVVLADMTEADRKAYVMADNKLAELAGWDRDILAIELQFLQDVQFDDIEVTGFVAMIADAIRDVTRRAESVLDPFAGMGTTVIATEKTGRRARAIEYDPAYCDVIVRRWQKYTGKTAILDGSGRTFEDIEGERTIFDKPLSPETDATPGGSSGVILS